ncbi:MAG: NADH-quinone oxidoreductase subunit L, partial [Pseudomonadota bacterium]
AHAHEPPWVVTVPLILLAIPSLAIGYLTVEPIVFGGALSDAITVLAAHDPLIKLSDKFHGAFEFALHGFVTPVFWLAMLGVALATLVYRFKPDLAAQAKRRAHWLWSVLDRKYGFDEFYQHVITAGGLKVARWFSAKGDGLLIDGWLVHGSARMVSAVSDRLRTLQTGFLYHYAFAMIIGLVALVFAFVLLR